jgi:signal transduction histidine kinase
MKPTGEGIEGGSVWNKTFIEANQNPMGDRALIGRGSGRDQKHSDYQEREWLASLGPIVLAEIIEEVLACQRTLYEAAGINVKLEFEDNLPAVRLDETKIKQVILNLCKNSVEAMPDGGCLTIRSYHSASMVILEIRDTGTGIPSELEVFRLFNTTKPGGGGLGLPLVERIVSAHKGSIQYVSRPDHGTTFRVCFPAGTKLRGLVETCHLGQPRRKLCVRPQG